MGCGASAAPKEQLQQQVQQKDAQLRQKDAEVSSLQRQLDSLRKVQLEVGQKDAEIALLRQELNIGSSKEIEKTSIAITKLQKIQIDALQHFLFKGVPAAYETLEKAKKHGLRNTEAMVQKVGLLQKDASKLREVVEQYRQQVQYQCEEMRGDAEKLDVEVSALAENLDMSTWLSEDLIAAATFEFKLVRADSLRAWSGEPLPCHQELEAILGQGSLQTVSISIMDLFSDCALLKSILVLSHRWVNPGSPDPEGKQQAVIIEHLKTHTEIEYVWQDWWCIPQGTRSEKEQDYFDKTLDHVYMLFLGAQVLLLLDMQYLGRFWTSYEAWLSMRRVTEQGFYNDDARVTIQCLGAAGVMEQSLRDTWGPLTIEQAHTKLSQEDIVVTNQRDKDQQLTVLESLSCDLPNIMSLLNEVCKGKQFALSMFSTYDTIGTIKLTPSMGGIQVQDQGEAITVSQGSSHGAVMSEVPLAMDRPTCVVATFSYSGSQGYWTPVGLQCQRANKSQVDFYCDYAFDTHAGYSGGNAQGSYNNVTFPGGIKPTMSSGNSATVLFEPTNQRLLLLQHHTQKAFAFIGVDPSRPWHLHVATYQPGNVVTLRAPTADELKAVQSVEDVATVDAKQWPVTRV